jgi:ABC-type transport system involved in multi-copper enzyme maturation permease subunit
MGGLFPIAGNTLRELARSKLFYNLVLFSALLIGASIFVAQLTVGEWKRIILDMGLSSIEGVGVLLACLIGVGLVAGEIDRRTIYPTLAKPVTRATFLTARYLGLALTLAANVALMLGVLALTLRMAGSQYTPAAGRGPGDVLRQLHHADAGGGLLPLDLSGRSSRLGPARVR